VISGTASLPVLSRHCSILVGMLTLLLLSHIFSFMIDTFKYKPDDLAAIVWPRQNAPRVFAGEISWQEAVSGSDTGWAIDVEKADRVRVLIAVHDDVIEDACRVIAATHHAEIPQGKTRKINRSHFDTVQDPRLAFLRKAPSPLLRRRNPQGVIELRDLPGADALLSSVQPPAHGVVQLGAYTLIVAGDGSAELRIPSDGLVGIRVAS
jgi:hypothetical protein